MRGDDIVAIFAKRGQIVKAIVFPRGRIFAVMNLQTLLPVANAATPAVAVDGFPPQFFPLRRLNISGITARTTNGFFYRDLSRHSPSFRTTSSIAARAA